MTTAMISSSMLRWARERASLELDRLAEKVNVRADKLQRWESGEVHPTFIQAQSLARALHIPFGFLFLSAPPQESLPIPDLRTLGNHPMGQISTDLRDLVSDILRKQDWYRTYLQEQGVQPPAFIGKFQLDADASCVAEDMTVTLKLMLSDREEVSNGEAFLSLLMKKAEEAGVWVMRSGIVGGNTHRPLSVQEFRGFALCDEFAPVVFINGKDASAAQIFTLVHELAHLWIGQSGISDLSLAQPNDTPHQVIERFCNTVAAEVLVPKNDLCNHWIAAQSVEQNITQLATFFRVSTVVIARRAFDLKLISWADYTAHYQQQAALWKKKKEEKESGGSFYRSLPVKNGRRFTQAVLQSALGRDLLLRDAGKLLGINPAKIGRLAKEIGFE